MALLSRMSCTSGAHLSPTHSLVVASQPRMGIQDGAASLGSKPRSESRDGSNWAFPLEHLPAPPLPISVTERAEPAVIGQEGAGFPFRVDRPVERQVVITSLDQKKSCSCLAGFACRKTKGCLYGESKVPITVTVYLAGRSEAAGRGYQYIWGNASGR